MEPEVVFRGFHRIRGAEAGLDRHGIRRRDQIAPLQSSHYGVRHMKFDAAGILAGYDHLIGIDV